MKGEVGREKPLEVRAAVHRRKGNNRFAGSFLPFLPKAWFPESSVQSSCLDAFKGHPYVLQDFPLSQDRTCAPTSSLPHHFPNTSHPPLASIALPRLGQLSLVPCFFLGLALL